MEYWNLYDEHGKRTENVITRGEKIPDGFFHIVVETLIKHQDGTYLVMQRDFTKKEMPGLYEGSAGGSVLAGENIEKGAIREVYEETGLVINGLEKTYYRVYPERGTIHQGFIAVINGDKKAISYQKGETISHKWLTLAELKAFVLTPAYNQNHRSRLLPYLEKKH